MLKRCKPKANKLPINKGTIEAKITGKIVIGALAFGIITVEGIQFKEEPIKNKIPLRVAATTPAVAPDLSEKENVIINRF
ncbi:MAG: hypothetical protein EAZ55_04020 [Cytophagales bacterium]|nr:MAG: hypothetical protein EAZ55_04020 [Cytophagales bacterium]